MTDNKPDNFPSTRTCIECGELVSQDLVNTHGRCTACQQTAERFIEDFSMSLGRWASSLKASRLDSKPAAKPKRKFTFLRMTVAIFLVLVGYYAFNFITNYHLIQTQWFLENGNITKARYHLEKAIEADRESPNLRFVLGNLYYQQGKFNSAIDAFQQTIEMDSLHAGALNNLAWIYTRLNIRLDEALSLSKRSLDLDPDNPSYLDTMAEIYFLKKEYYRALTYMRKAVEQNPRDIEYYRRRLEIIKKLVYRQSRFIEV